VQNLPNHVDKHSENKNKSFHNTVIDLFEVVVKKKKKRRRRRIYFPQKNNSNYKYS